MNSDISWITLTGAARVEHSRSAIERRFPRTFSFPLLKVWYAPEFMVVGVRSWLYWGGVCPTKIVAWDTANETPRERPQQLESVAVGASNFLKNVLAHERVTCWVNTVIAWCTIYRVTNRVLCCGAALQPRPRIWKCRESRDMKNPVPQRRTKWVITIISGIARWVNCLCQTQTSIRS